jgi:hypothetical protein
MRFEFASSFVDFAGIGEPRKVFNANLQEESKGSVKFLAQTRTTPVMRGHCKSSHFAEATQIDTSSNAWPKPVNAHCHP